MIPLKQFLASVAKNASRVREYRLGGDGTGGQCDCVGLVIGAVRLCGEKWPGIHGSNYAARHLLADGIRRGAPLQLGDLVFKGRAPGEKGYSLPARYRDGGDETDYYHVGVVTALSPLEITHCTSVPGGIRRDTSRGKWQYSGWLRLVARENKGDDTMQIMTVTAANGRPVNLRSGPGKDSAVIAAVPVGDTVTAQADRDGWAFVAWGEKSGYMMDEFLTEAGAKEEADGVERLLHEIVTLANEALRKMNSEK